ncbi:putative selenate ABC transporter substrate-binding protein [Shewanella sp. 1CM18E]|uniref:putative selenate ABC transporter substrate-binding protein n=1 Tax=Shewanella sp. 1CM18E TaxID=2929169 RepID=UPI0020C1472C|nr:putative selenate ABC transporter substrate-binding protein [Shewanella sp. 1CM18E]MCK8047344.1 putative selenate ABC transporter substrate-binding protein [Shewanella sp. 1CM18E]
MSLTKRLALLLALVCTPAAMAQTFTFTAIPDEDESQLRTRFEKVAEYLEQELGVKVKYIPVKSYSAAVTAFRNNQVQLAWFGGLSGVQARRLVPGSEAIAQGYEDQFFKSYFIAHASTEIVPDESFPNINGYTFTFGAKNSTSGRLMPQFFIERNLGKNTKDVFKRIGYSGDHSRTIAQVQAGVYQVGAVNYKVWETAVANGKVDLEKVDVIWQSPAYPDYQWTIRGDVDSAFGAEFADKVTAALIGMTDTDLLNSFPRESFVPADNRDYEPIEDVAKAIGLID